MTGGVVSVTAAAVIICSVCGLWMLFLFIHTLYGFGVLPPLNRWIVLALLILTVASAWSGLGYVIGWAAVSHLLGGSSNAAVTAGALTALAFGGGAFLGARQSARRGTATIVIATIVLIIVE